MLLSLLLRLRLLRFKWGKSSRGGLVGAGEFWANDGQLSIERSLLVVVVVVVVAQLKRTFFVAGQFVCLAREANFVGAKANGSLCVCVFVCDRSFRVHCV